MSRIGKKPVEIPKGVEVSLNGQNMSVKGPRANWLLPCLKMSLQSMMTMA